MNQEYRKTLALLHLQAFQESVSSVVVEASPSWTSLGVWIADRVSCAIVGMDLREPAAQDKIRAALRAVFEDLVLHEVLRSIRLMDEMLADSAIVEKANETMARLKLPIEICARPDGIGRNIIQVMVGYGDRYNASWDYAPSGFLLQVAQEVSRAKSLREALGDCPHGCVDDGCPSKQRLRDLVATAPDSNKVSVDPADLRHALLICHERQTTDGPTVWVACASGAELREHIAAIDRIRAAARLSRLGEPTNSP